MCHTQAVQEGYSFQAAFALGLWIGQRLDPAQRLSVCGGQSVLRGACDDEFKIPVVGTKAGIQTCVPGEVCAGPSFAAGNVESYLEVFHLFVVSALSLAERRSFASVYLEQDAPGHACRIGLRQKGRLA